VAYKGGNPMVLNYTRSEIKQDNKSKVENNVDFSTLSKQKKHEINKLLSRITMQQD
jgi:hypothetical protein